MKVAPVAAAAAASPGLKGVRLSEQSVSLSRAGSPPQPPPPGPPRGLPLGAAEQAAAAASLLMDMKGCYSRLAGLVPTLPRHRRVSKVEILQHVIDYIWDLELELQHPLGAAPSPPRAADETAGAGTEQAACVNPDDRILCR